jgi:predicted 2-oxoglutarate/Fe(II)-dependent dioxygenase YbiX
MDINFTEQECKNIINLRYELEEMKSNKFFPNNKNLSYSVWNVYRNDNTQWIFDKLFLFFEKKIGIKIIKQIDILHIHRYLKGEKFHKHTDEYFPTQIYNIGVCLNDEYGGGEFILYNPTIELPKKTGSIYTFKSSRQHEVKEITDGERWSMICFLHIENLDLKKQLL